MTYDLVRSRIMRLFAENYGAQTRTENREFFKSFKEQLKTRFNQLDLWITSYPIDII